MINWENVPWDNNRWGMNIDYVPVTIGADDGTPYELIFATLAEFKLTWGTMDNNYIIHFSDIEDYVRPNDPLLAPWNESSVYYIQTVRAKADNVIIGDISLAEGDTIPATKPKVPVIIILGQSNADGRCDNSNMDASVASFVDSQTSVNVWYKPMGRSGGDATIGSFVDDGELYTLSNTHSNANKKTSQTVRSNNVDESSLTHHGIEQYLAYEWGNEYGTDKVVIAKCAMGDSSIYSEWSIEQEQDDKLWYLFREFVWKPLAAHLDSIGWEAVPVCAYWMQGESDCKSTLAPYYEQRLQVLVNKLRSQIGSVDLPIIIGGLSDHYDDTYGSIVKSAQASVATANEGVYLVPTDGTDGKSPLPKLSDDIHYTATGQQIQASRVFEIIKSVYDSEKFYVNSSGSFSIGSTRAYLTPQAYKDTLDPIPANNTDQIVTDYTRSAPIATDSFWSPWNNGDISFTVRSGFVETSVIGDIALANGDGFVAFDGSGVINTSYSPNIEGKLVTVDFYEKNIANVPNRYLLDTSNGATGFLLRRYKTAVTLYIYSDTGQQKSITTTDCLDGWNRLTLLLDNNNLTLTLNGSSTTGSLGGSFSVGTLPMVVGGRVDSDQDRFVGGISQVSIGDELVYNLDTQFGNSTIIDSSGNGNDGTIVGATWWKTVNGVPYTGAYLTPTAYRSTLLRPVENNADQRVIYTDGEPVWERDDPEWNDWNLGGIGFEVITPSTLSILTMGSLHFKLGLQL